MSDAQLNQDASFVVLGYLAVVNDNDCGLRVRDLVRFFD